jgi:predicted metalloprotease
MATLMHRTRLLTPLVVLLAVVLLAGVACGSQQNGSDNAGNNSASNGNQGGANVGGGQNGSDNAGNKSTSNGNQGGANVGSGQNGSDNAGNKSTSNGTQTPGEQATGLGNSSSNPPSYAGDVSGAQTQNALRQLPPASSVAQEASSQLPELSDTQQPTVEDFVAAVSQDIDAFWAQEFERFESYCQSTGGGAQASQYATSGSAQASQYATSGSAQANQYGQSQGGNNPACSVSFTYRSPRLVEFVGSTPSPCGDVTGAAYCPEDQTLYIELSEQVEHAQQYNGDVFIIAASVAHEFGHHVQNRMGYFDPNRPGVVVTFQGEPVPFENQADCLSGVWASSVNWRGMINQTNVIDAMKYRASIGEPFSSHQTHGTPKERATWWYGGFQGGDASQCTGQQFDTSSASATQ